MRIRRSYAIPATALLLASLAAPALAEVVNGTNGPDVLYGTAEADTIRGFRGADTVYARAGNDSVHGGLGADRIYGRTGADRLFAGVDSRPDVVRGGPGPDRLYVRVGPTGRGRDSAYGGEGNDRITVVHVANWQMPFVDCGPGKDTLVLPPGVGMDGPGCERVVSAPPPLG